MELRDEIIEYRRINGYTQTEFAKLCGVMQSTISYIENGKGNLRFPTEKKIREVLGSSPCENRVEYIQWVSIRERLPKTRGPFLVRVANIDGGCVTRTIDFVRFYPDRSKWEIRGPRVVTYWTERLNPPKDEWL